MRQVQIIKPTHAFPRGQGGSSLTNYLCSTIKYWPLAHIVSGQEAMKLIIFKTSPPCMCMGGWVLCCICPVTAVACHPHCHWPVILVVAPVIDVVVPPGGGWCGIIHCPPSLLMCCWLLCYWVQTKQNGNRCGGVGKGVLVSPFNNTNPKVDPSDANCNPSLQWISEQWEYDWNHRRW